jgi:hypothetical protein
VSHAPIGDDRQPLGKMFGDRGCALGGCVARGNFARVLKGEIAIEVVDPIGPDAQDSIIHQIINPTPKGFTFGFEIANAVVGVGVVDAASGEASAESFGFVDEGGGLARSGELLGAGESCDSGADDEGVEHGGERRELKLNVLVEWDVCLMIQWTGSFGCRLSIRCRSPVIVTPIILD